jgi:adenine/guanine/hypoxanthine permease
MSIFRLSESGTTVCTEILAGITTWLAMVYMPDFATAPALVFVACSMARALRDLDWEDLTEYLPTVATALAMPFAFSIAAGIGLGFIVYAAVKTLAGRWREVSGAVWLIAAASGVKFAIA